MNYLSVRNRLFALVTSLGERASVLEARKRVIKSELRLKQRDYDDLYEQFRGIEDNFEDTEMWEELLTDVDCQLVNMMDTAIGRLEEEQNDIEDKFIDINAAFEFAENELKKATEMTE